MSTEMITITLLVLVFFAAGFALYRYAHGTQDEETGPEMKKKKFINALNPVGRILIKIRASRVVVCRRGYYTVKVNWWHPFSWCAALLIFVSGGLTALAEFNND